jgi:hypothetical protein
MLRQMPEIKAIAWSQLPSRGAAQLSDGGNLHWDVRYDPVSKAILRGIVDDGLRKPAAASP